MKNRKIEFICTFEKEYAAMDYGNGDCIRLIAFDRLLINGNSENIETFFVDIETKFFEEIKSVNGKKYTHRFMESFKDGRCYILLKCYHFLTEDAYYYRAFNLPDDSESTKCHPIKIESLSFQSINNYKIKDYLLILDIIGLAIKTPSKKIDLSLDNNIVLKAYQVGQGMCSLLHNSKQGYLIDCGIGTPFKKQHYKNILNNNLLDDIKNLSSISLILSHLDSDHYRLISWDAFLLSKIDSIYIPCGVSGIICKDVLINNKIHHCESIKLQMNIGNLQSYRTNPNNISCKKNDNALVTLITTTKECILYPADYSYYHMKNDMNKNINLLASLKYSFIIVPHHGDKNSAKDIFSPKNVSALAFFSAGDNEKYKHPTKASIDAHSKLGYIPIEDRYLEDLESIKVPL